MTVMRAPSVSKHLAGKLVETLCCAQARPCLHAAQLARLRREVEAKAEAVQALQTELTKVHGFFHSIGTSGQEWHHTAEDPGKFS